MPDIGMTSYFAGEVAQVRAARSEVDIVLETPIQSVTFVAEYDEVTVVVTAEGAEPVSSSIRTDAAVKVTEIKIDPDDPNHITVLTY